MERPVELVGVEIANLRGFVHASIGLREGMTLLVGPNNSGKTSMLRLLSWALNEADVETLSGLRSLDPAVLALLKPARETRNAARRLTLHVRVRDGRRWQRFRCDQGVTQLRIGLRHGTELRLNLGAPRRGETASDETAIALFDEVKRHVAFTYIPASRGAASEGFKTAFRDAVVARLEERALHKKRSGAPSEYRTVKNALGRIESVIEPLLEPLWTQIRASIPAGLARSGVIAPELEPGALVEWIADRTTLRISTGDHDVDAVDPIEVGSGLQSVLELAIQGNGRPGDVDHILGVEEPEAFLHPSAQRSLARMLARQLSGKRIVSTHSPILVDEADFDDVVLVREHRFFAPSRLSQRRTAINSALLTGRGAEMAFARSVLLVEGEGDRLFYEQLRRRIARASGDGRLDQLLVLPVLSKSFFAPWLRLLSAYGIAGDRPIDFIALWDSDATAEVRKACTEARVYVPRGIDAALDRVDRSNKAGDGPAEREKAVRSFNELARRSRVPVALSPNDLEWAMLSACSDDASIELGKRIGIDVAGRDSLIKKLRKAKAPYVRGMIGDEIRWSDISEDSRSVLVRWLTPGMTRRAARALVASPGRS